MSGGHPGPMGRVRAWWRGAPLAMVFSVHLVVYLVAATMLAAWLVDVAFSGDADERFVIALTGDERLQALQDLYAGPYLYDRDADELVPASELIPSSGGAVGVFVGRVMPSEGEAPQEGAALPNGTASQGGTTPPDKAASQEGTTSLDGAALQEGGPGAEDEDGPVYATMDDVASGEVALYDWGLNFPDEDMREEVLSVGEAIDAEELPAYDHRMREERVDVIPELMGAASPGPLLSNVAYYASSAPADPLLLRVVHLAEGLAPLAIYGAMGWFTFRRFYRVHIAEPLGELEGAANRIAGQDLDFAVPRVRGRELGRLSGVMEDMRASLLVTNRELWRTLDERRRLNAAFAHDLRTPVTVLKGTVEMARLRLAGGAEIGEGELATLGEQADRLGRYAEAMGGISRLEERRLVCETRTIVDLFADLEAQGAQVVAAHAPKLAFRAERLGGEPGLGHEPGTGDGSRAGNEPVPSESERVPSGDEPVPSGNGPVQVDTALVGEVLGNLVRNACSHASTQVMLSLRAEPLGECGGVVEPGENCAVMLVLTVADDGPGFSPEALMRGTEPFYGESKSSEHFGLGLSIAQTLVRLHGGSLTLANAPEGGARVTATFRCELVG